MDEEDIQRLAKQQGAGGWASEWHPAAELLHQAGLAGLSQNGEGDLYLTGATIFGGFLVIAA